LQLLLPAPASIRRLQESEGRYYWSGAFEVVLRKHGLIDVRTVTAVSDPETDLVWMSRGAPWSDTLAASALIVEGPLHASIADALGVGLGEALPVDALELRIQGRPAGSTAYPEFEVRRIPRTGRSSDPPQAYVPRDRLWSAGPVVVRPLLLRDGWQELWTSPVGGGEIVVAARRGNQVVTGFPLFDLLARSCAFPPLEEGFWTRTRFCSGLELEESLVRLAGELLPAGAVSPQAARWPAGFDSAITVRHDYDRPIDDATLAEVLALHRELGTRATWFFLVRNVDRRQLDAIRSDGHEIAWHANPSGPEAFAHEEKAFIAAAGTRPLGMSAHGGRGSQGYLGHHQFAHGERAGHLYGEMLGQVNRLPHASVSLEEGYPTPGPLVVPPVHNSLDAGMKPEAHYLETLLEDLPAQLRRGAHVVIMNHPDIHVPQLRDLLQALVSQRCWSATMAEVASWTNTTKVASRTCPELDGARVLFGKPLPGSLPLARRPGGPTAVTAPAGATEVLLE
jgi:hypothetical protein